MQEGMVTLTTTSTPDHSGEQLTLSSVQESSQTSTERLQRKRRATEPVFSSSIQKGVTCANPKLLYQVLYNATQGALSSRYTLERNCQNVGLKFHGETPGNGNCFFEAVSSQLQRLKYPVQLSPQQLRQDAVAFLKDNQLLQVSDGYIDLAEFMCNESFEEYCARMAENGEWADHVLVVAMARTLQRDIMIVTSAPASGNDDNVAWVIGQDNFQGDPILLGHIWEHHYESLEPSDSTELEVKCQRQAVEKMGFEANDTKNQIDMFGKYGGQAVFLGAPAYNQDTINPIQVPMNQMSMFGSYRADNVRMGFSGDSNSGQRNPFQYAPQIQMNQMGLLGNDGGDKEMTVFSGDHNFGIGNTVQYDPHFQMNQMDVFGNYGDHTVMPSVPIDNRFGLINPIQDDVQSQMLITEDSSEHFQYSEDSSEYSSDSDDDDYEMTKNRKRGQKYLARLRSYLSDKPSIVHLVDKDFAIDNSVEDSKLEKLKRTIFEVASQQPYWGEQIPTRWFLLEQQLIKLRDAGVKVISHDDVEKLNKEGTVQIKDSEEMDLFLTYLHETGTIIYFNIEVLKDNIILDPIWLIDALKLLINAHPNLPESPAENESQSDSPADSDIRQKWHDFKDKGILSPELVDALWTKEKHPQIHANKDHLLRVMEQFNIIAKPRSFSEIGVKEENYFLAPCMLQMDSPKEVIDPEQDPRMVSTPVLCYIFRGKYLPPPIFHRLIAACVSRWPVAKKKDTSDNLIFCGCCVFDIGLFHRLTLHCRNHIIYVRITKMVIDEVKRRFITLNLTKITSCIGPNLQYELRYQTPPPQSVSEDGMVGFSPQIDIWFGYEGHDPDAPITQEHMNHARLSVALVTVFGNALRDILLTYFQVPYQDIYQVILVNKAKLTMGRERLLNQDQGQLVFPDPLGQTTGTVNQFDLSLLYILIRNISTVPAPLRGWGKYPQDQPRDISLGASVERIRFFRNHISGHSPNAEISQQDLGDYWNKFDDVLHDIEAIMGGTVYSQQFENQKRNVISIYEAC
ncbi:hypothetical protein ACJMK2_001801 [Sinanodonta woodiana]|uniref:OTU domain-containing protein n=2 Tax=Sinanodonta woodiana TaxID=1069815 RepID=A0ABD3XTA6_SINWO